MKRFLEIEGRRLDLLALSINSTVLGASVFVTTLAGTAVAGITSLKASFISAGLAAGLKVTSYLVWKLGLQEGATPPQNPPSPPSGM